MKGSKDTERTTLGLQTDISTYRLTDRPTDSCKKICPLFQGGGGGIKIIINPTHSFLGATSDGRVVEYEGSSGGLLKIKCPYFIKVQNISNYEIPVILSMNDKNFCLETLPTEPTLMKSHKCYAQVQGEMAYKGLSWVDFVVWTATASNNIFVEIVFFDVQYVSSMMPKLVNFYIEKIYPLLYTV